MTSDRSLPRETKSPATGRRRVFLSRILFVANVTLLVLAVVLFIVTAYSAAGTDLENILDIGLTYLAIILTSSVVGLLIVSRYPTHAVGWLLLLVGLFAAFTTVAAALGELEGTSASALPEALFGFGLWLGGWVWVPMVLLPLIFIPLYFPNGRLLSKRWRWVVGAAVVGLASGIVGSAINPAEGTNPLQLAGGAALANFLLNYIFGPMSGLAIIATLISLLLRYRRADRAQRAQMKWVLYTLGMVIVSSSLMEDLLSAAFIPEPWRAPLSSVWEIAVLWLLGVAPPLAIGIAILRYRLYDIDLIIRRTLVYGLVTALLAAVYFGSVVLLQQAFAGLTGEQSPVAVVISTLVIAALFSPVRGRVQRFINRRFYRQQYDAAETLAQFGAVARQEVDLETLTGSLLQVVDQTMQPAELTLWLAPVSAGRDAADG